MRLGSRPCDYRRGATIWRHRRPGSLPHPEPSRAPDLDLSLQSTLPGASHSGIMLTVKYDDGAMETTLPPWYFRWIRSRVMPGNFGIWRGDIGIFDQFVADRPNIQYIFRLRRIRENPGPLVFQRFGALNHGASGGS